VVGGGPVHAWYIPVRRKQVTNDAGRQKADKHTIKNESANNPHDRIVLE